MEGKALGKCTGIKQESKAKIHAKSAKEKRKGRKEIRFLCALCVFPSRSLREFFPA
jgi:hypothetical protein